MKIYSQNIYLNKTVYLNVGPRSPTIHRPQGIRWPQFLNCSLLDLCLSANFINLFLQYKAAGVRKNVVTMYSLSIHFTPPGVTSERRLEGLCIHFLICCLLSVCNIFTTPTTAYEIRNLIHSPSKCGS